ncbi:IS110 family transposase [Oscillospiraceae bacterium HV4-5-C5C]|nr:IS110 family transposase [Oscillospiraceae bacterium HV4-5-C5C]
MHTDYDAIILAEIGDISRFPSEKQIVSCTGLDTIVNESCGFKAQGPRSPNVAHLT